MWLGVRLPAGVGETYSTSKGVRSAYPLAYAISTTEVIDSKGAHHLRLLLTVRGMRPAHTPRYVFQPGEPMWSIMRP